ncbi:molecular chaperone DnaJ [Sphingomonas sp.]|uniref:molecular chaperone DnaJ n=1 Tax=Sphingomonas sp. TaxID=28214 RepID=UPI003B3A3337
MIGLVLLAAAAAGYWAWRTRDPQAIRIGDVAAAIAALVALKLLKTNMPMGLFALGGAGWWLWFRRNTAVDVKMSREEACRLLDLPPDATAQEVRSAHRRLVARVHPDVGGSNELARRVNQARDILLRRNT